VVNPSLPSTTETQSSQRLHNAGVDRNQILAPEEPNVYSTAINRTARAPAERNVSDDDCRKSSKFRSAGARRTLLESRVL